MAADRRGLPVPCPSEHLPPSLLIICPAFRPRTIALPGLEIYVARIDAVGHLRYPAGAAAGESERGVLNVSGRELEIWTGWLNTGQTAMNRYTATTHRGPAVRLCFEGSRMGVLSNVASRLRVTLSRWRDEAIVDGVGHRSYVGGAWERIGRMQFEFMVRQGLKPHHVLCDVACGSLRGGVKFIPYLDPGNYLGIDISRQLIDAGIEKELGDLRDTKRPEFVVSDRFEFNRFSKRPDFAIAQSLFTHLIESDILLCLKNLRDFAKPNTKFFVTFFEAAEPSENPLQSNPHERFSYTRQQMEQFGKSTGWRPRYIGDWNHPRGQLVFEYSL